MFDINAVVKDAAKGLDELFTSDEERAKLDLALEKMRVGLASQLIERNKAIALSSWIGRWPDFIGCVLALGLFVDLLLKPILAPFGVIIPDLNEKELMGFAATLLGLSGINAFKKN
jgi:hypothetical protein